jgi:hypothetical protein
MSAKKKVQKGPSWLEVGLGAFLSVVLGVILGAAYMVAKPVVKVAALPKEPAAGTLYYIEGSRDFSKDAMVKEKRKSFVDGESVSLTEGELNLLLGSLSAPDGSAAPKPSDKPSEKPIEISALNGRLHDGRIQLSDVISYNILSVTGTIVVQADGTLTRHGAAFVFDPDQVYVGGCPVQRFLFLRGWIESKLLFPRPAPDDVAAAWSKLLDVTIEGSTLHLKGPQG